MRTEVHNNLELTFNTHPLITYLICRYNNMFDTHSLLPFWPCSSVGKVTVIKSEDRGFDSRPGQSFALSLRGPISLIRANDQMG